MSKQAGIRFAVFETFSAYSSENSMNLKYILHQILSFFIINCAFPMFVFFLVFTLGLRERDSKLRLREIMHCVIKKLF